MKHFKGLIWFLIFFILIEAFIFRNPSLYGLVPKSFIGQIIDLENRFKAQDSSQIEWIILGDSQAMDAVRPPLIAKQLGIEADKLFNLSISGGKPVNELHLLQKSLPKLNNLKGVLIVVGEHQFNNTALNKDIKFRYDANLKERILASDISERADLLLGGISYGYGLRDVWWQIGKEVWEKKIPIDQLKNQEVKYKYPWGLDPVPWSAPEYKTEQYAKETADRWLNNFEIEGPHTVAFLDTVELLDKSNIPWVVVQLPRMILIEDAINKQYPNEQKAYYHFIEETVETYNKEFIINEFPKLPDDAFRDINHVNEKGAKLLAPSLTNIILNLK